MPRRAKRIRGITSRRREEWFMNKVRERVPGVQFKNLESAPRCDADDQERPRDRADSNIHGASRLTG
jgi:hypothetical protein